ncbi:MAG TPA: ribosome silencing factor, partial [Vicinamibacterales bacterium]|nr:ribosome silencing factor [Vicinamibacterales bacterium]
MAKTSASKRVATPRRKAAAKLPKSVLGAVRAAQDKKGLDVVVLDLRKAGGFTDFFVICTGTNPRQITAIADSVEDTLRTEFGERPHLTEGVEKSQWILLD